ncbi:unnamed protein product, partial [Musa textilis]
QHERHPSHLRLSRTEQQHRHKPLVVVPLRGKRLTFRLPTTLACSPNLPRRRIRGSPTLGRLEKRGKGHCRFQTNRHVEKLLLPLLAAEYNASGQPTRPKPLFLGDESRAQHRRWEETATDRARAPAQQRRLV